MTHVNTSVLDEEIATKFSLVQRQGNKVRKTVLRQHWNFATRNMIMYVFTWSLNNEQDVKQGHF